MVLFVFALAATEPAVLEKCPGDNPPLEVSQGTSTEIWEKSYTVGEAKQVVVGETVLRRKQFVEMVTFSPAYCLLNDVTLKAGIGRRFSLNAGTLLRIRGWLSADHRRHEIAQWGSNSAFLVDENLNVYPKLSNPTDFGWIVMLPKIDYQVGPAKVGRTSTESRNRTTGSENIELVYNGTDGQSLRFQYREYTADDMARPAFAQELTYPAKAKTVRFKGFTLRIVAVSDDGMTYIIEDDGIKTAE